MPGIAGIITDVLPRELAAEQLRRMLGVLRHESFYVCGSWFDERAPVSPLTPNMLVTEPLPHFVSRSVGVCGGDIYVRQTRRGNVIFGGGHGWGDAELGLARPQSEASFDSMMRVVELLLASSGISPTSLIQPGQNSASAQNTKDTIFMSNDDLPLSKILNLFENK